LQKSARKLWSSTSEILNIEAFKQENMVAVTDSSESSRKHSANYNNIGIELAKYEYLLNVIYRNPRIMFNRKNPKRVYLDKVEEFIRNGYTLVESLQETLRILEKDYREGLVGYHPYYRARKTLEELLKRARYLGVQVYFKELLADFLLMICKMERVNDGVKASTFSKWLGIDLETANRFFRWLKGSEYEIVAKCIIKSKKQGTS